MFFQIRNPQSEIRNLDYAPCSILFFAWPDPNLLQIYVKRRLDLFTARAGGELTESWRFLSWLNRRFSFVSFVVGPSYPALVHGEVLQLFDQILIQSLKG